MQLSYIFPDGEPWGIRCTASIKLCRLFAHLLFTVSPHPPLDPLSPMVGGATFSLDGGPWIGGAPATFETHLIPPENRSLVFTVNYDALQPLTDALPRELCARPWAVAADGTKGTLPPFCMTLNATTALEPAADSLHAQLLFGNWSVVCSAALNKCRTLGHLALLASPRGVVTPMAAGGALSFDEGQHWYEAGASATWLSKFDEIDGRVYQRFHLAFDVPSAGALPPPRRSVCVRAWMQDLSEAVLEDVDMRNCSKPTGCGAARSESVRCWPLEVAGWVPRRLPEEA
mmetsp:Transcript_73044/g.219338  ORF Transcript_73044/g.219338 Transcript_73044/m.219338 type:complete len:287 (-) Transcript_73044:148-1008(-)